MPSWEQIEDYKQSMIEYSKSINLPEFPDFSVCLLINITMEIN